MIMPDLATAALIRKRAELAARLAELENQAVPIRADIFHLDAALAILRGRDVPRMRAQHRPEWFANLGRLILDILRGAHEPMTARAIAVEVLRLAGRDVGDRAAVEIVDVPSAGRSRGGSASWSGWRWAAQEGVAGSGLTMALPDRQ